MSVPFASRHIGPSAVELDAMAAHCGYANADALVEQAIPAAVRHQKPLDLPEGARENDALTELSSIAERNTVCRSFIGMGYYGTVTPLVIRRLILENPGWYTPYTLPSRDRPRSPRSLVPLSNPRR